MIFRISFHFFLKFLQMIRIDLIRIDSTCVHITLFTSNINKMCSMNGHDNQTIIDNIIFMYI